MKLSRYNIEKKEDKSCLIYNTVTSAILELDTDYEKTYYEMKEGKKCSKPDLESALLEGGMLVEDDKDEFAELLIRNKIERFADSNLTLTIAPTMACNFCCPYCYEKGREYITMSEAVQDQLTSQLKEKYQHIHELTVSWYGGEPLLAIETIEKLTKKIKSVLPLGCKYNADMVTNGYKLTRRVAEKLKDMDIHYIQVTLDGSKQAHDSRRILHNHQPTFEYILDNIRECADILNISIRINVDKTNINEATEIFDWLERYGLKGRVGYYLAPVDDINGVYGQEYQEAYVSFERIKSILEIKEQSKGCIRLNEIKQIRIQDLNFAYDQKETIKSFSTNLKKGKVYGLKGENGCGKSTLIKILMGMYVDEYQGNIIWNDTEMRNLDMDYIREHVISVTEQEPTLIADTIYNNIALYRKLDVKCIQRAVDCFGDSILKRDNWDLQINEKSSNISGGEKQKIAIIRQVVQDGQVMIFDEPTSAMDESGKKQFLQLIDQIKNHKIIIIVSHDNAILNTCDEILIL